VPEFRARYEFKYLISEAQMDFIREVVQIYADADAYGDNGKYTVCSLYYDTWDWVLARQTVEGVRNRYKLRIRTYGFTDDMPVFVENKGRVGTSICKTRALIPRSHWALLSNSAPPPPEGFTALKASHQADYDAYRNVSDLIDARPRLWVCYEREAYGSSYGDGARLTFDSDLRIQAPDFNSIDVPDENAWQRVKLAGEQIILELKFNGAFPGWMRTIVQSQHLRRVSCSKYVQGVEQLGDVPWNRVEWREQWMVY
jgi:SPX domain protein involved in polyphosphate accumulation